MYAHAAEVLSHFTTENILKIRMYANVLITIFTALASTFSSEIGSLHLGIAQITHCSCADRAS